MTSIELIQFRFSPYNEKVRWALDLKGVSHRRRSVLPGPHAALLQKHTGQTATPALKLNGRWLAGSAAILDALDQAFPSPPLWPTDVDRSRGHEIEILFDEGWGPRIRRAVLAALLTDLDYLCACFAGHKPSLIRAAYRAIMPLARGMIAKGNGIAGLESVRDGALAARAALEFVESERAGRPYLLGDVFSRADLVAAAHLAVLCDPPASPMQRPVPQPAALRALCESMADHSGMLWTRDVYRQYRGSAGDFDGFSVNRASVPRHAPA